MLLLSTTRQAQGILVGSKMTRWIYWLVVISISLLSEYCDAKGRAGTRVDPPQATTPQYPSLVRRYYYSYYISYFSSSGLIYAESGRENTRTVTTCENYEPYYDNATTLGVFPCPMENDPDDFNNCCGESRYEYCCRLVDTQNFRLAVGLGIAGALGLIIAIIVCICLALKSNQKQAKAKKDKKRQMLNAGIPRYESKNTGRYSSQQSTDGYMVVVRFKKKSFYEDVWSALRTKYAALAWRQQDGGTKKEVKVTYEDGSWVTLVLQDQVSGKPQMTVVREKAAVEWMESVFEEVCAQIPDDSGLCSCLSTTKQKQVHPEAGGSHKHRPHSGDHKHKYEMRRSRDLKDDTRKSRTSLQDNRKSSPRY